MNIIFKLRSNCQRAVMTFDMLLKNISQPSESKSFEGCYFLEASDRKKPMQWTMLYVELNALFLLNYFKKNNSLSLRKH